MQDTKLCRVCQVEKPLSEYRTIRDRGATHTQGMCRDCFNASSVSRYATNPRRRALQIAYVMNGSARVRADGGHVEAEDIAQLILTATHCCYCKQPNDGTYGFAVDHQHSLSIGGHHELSNLVVCCEPCNRAKHAMPIEMFNAWLKGVADRLAS